MLFVTNKKFTSKNICSGRTIRFDAMLNKTHFKHKTMFLFQLSRKLCHVFVYSLYLNWQCILLSTNNACQLTFTCNGDGTFFIGINTSYILFNQQWMLHCCSIPFMIFFAPSLTIWTFFHFFKLIDSYRVV